MLLTLVSVVGRRQSCISPRGVRLRLIVPGRGRQARLRSVTGGLRTAAGARRWRGAAGWRYGALLPLVSVVGRRQSCISRRAARLRRIVPGRGRQARLRSVTGGLRTAAGAHR